MPGFSSADWIHPTLLNGTGATQCNAGVIGGSAGQAMDTLLMGVYVQLNAGGAANLTIAGMKNASGNNANMLITGFTNQDYFWMPPSPVLNEYSAFVFTASVASVIWLFTRAYTGPS